MFIADFHIHSRYSRATSREMNVETITKWAKIKGIELVGTGDFTHYQWLSELEAYLTPSTEGIYHYKGVKFILTSEISCIFSEAGRVRKIHIMVFAPSFSVVRKINRELSRIGNLDSDGRPILGLAARQLVKIIMEISDRCFIVPAHIWTPHFSMFGANSGFDSIDECFGDQKRHIYTLETGLSSDPKMNWMLSVLDDYTLISNSDAHNPQNIGREANIFNTEIDYNEITTVLKNKDKKKFLGTIEFFPQEGKYHYDGHRNCDVVLSPSDTRRLNGICPKCRKRLTIGVLNRVYQLADREFGYTPSNSIPFKSMVPLREIIGESVGKTPICKEVEKIYNCLIENFGSELNVLINTSIGEIMRLHPRVAEGIDNVRQGRVVPEPGYDGVYGKIRLFKELREEIPAQMSLF